MPIFFFFFSINIYLFFFFCPLRQCPCRENCVEKNLKYTSRRRRARVNKLLLNIPKTNRLVRRKAFFNTSVLVLKAKKKIYKSKAALRWILWITNHSCSKRISTAREFRANNLFATYYYWRVAMTNEYYIVFF